MYDTYNDTLTNWATETAQLAGDKASRQVNLAMKTSQDTDS